MVRRDEIRATREVGVFFEIQLRPPADRTELGHFDLSKAEALSLRQKTCADGLGERGCRCTRV